MLQGYGIVCDHHLVNGTSNTHRDVGYRAVGHPAGLV